MKPAYLNGKKNESAIRLQSPDAKMGGVCFQTVQVRKQLKMAAAGCAGSVSGLGQQAKARPGAVSNHRHVRCLTLEEARCPVCLEILLEPVTMPCRHSVCLHCFKRTVECSGLCCPSCRLRVSSWARNKQSREKSLVNTELWDMVRLNYPERCGRRLEQRDRAMASEGDVNKLLLNSYETHRDLLS